MFSYFLMQTYDAANKSRFICRMIGEVDVKTSLPLSRFVKGMESFEVDFAVRGANFESSVMLAYGSRLDARIQ